MRALQKAVSRKQTEMSNQKKAFDSAKRSLEETVEQMITKLTNDNLQRVPPQSSTSSQSNPRKPLAAKT